MRLPQIIQGVLICLILFPNLGYSQRGLLEKANQQYELHNFKDAIVTYQRFLKNNRNNVEAMGKLADSFRHLDRSKEALRWHEASAYAGKQYPEFIFQHALTLKEEGRYAEARKLFLDYAETNPDVGIHFAESCTLALDKQSAPSTYTVTNEYLSSDAADFGPAFFGDGIVYSSSRVDFSDKDKQRDDLNQLFIASRDFNGNLGNPQLFHERFKGYNEGPLAYSPDGRWVALTKNNFVDGVRQIPSAGFNLNIFIAEVLQNGEWQSEKFFPFNGSSFSTGFPSFSPDGNALYFASDRPDGFGGFDIFVSYRTGKTWSTPENLGPTVNTPGNEITPFFDGQDLYFASDWHQGMGGFDIFRGARTGNNWDRIYNLDNQINSPKDDYGYIFDANKNTGYIVSNRTGGKGKTDIYKIARSYGGGVTTNTGGTGTYPPVNTGGNTGRPGGNTTNPYPGNTGTNPPYRPGTNTGDLPTTARTLEIIVLDEFSMRPIPNAEIDFTTCGQPRYYTNANGRYTMQIPAGLNCEAIIRQQGYISGLLRISGTSLNGVQSQQILLRSGNATTTAPPPPSPIPTTPTYRPPVTTTPPVATTGNLIMGRVYNPADNTGVTNVFIKAVNQNSGQILETSTAITGEYNLTLNPNSTYIITYSRAGFADVSRTVQVGNYADPNALGAFPLPGGSGNGPIAGTGTSSGSSTTTTGTNVGETSKAGTTNTNYGLAGYSVQVAAFNSSDKANFEKFRNLGTYGNVYNRYDGSRTKVRVGVFNTRAEAKAAADRIKRQGYRDAFVTDETMEGLGDGIILNGGVGTAVNTSTTTVNTGTNINTGTTINTGSTGATGVYKVRLASYRNPRFFKPSKVEGLGTLERRNKGPWTIMLLSGYPNLSDAIFAKNNAIKAGFRQAHIVLDNGYELTKVKF